MARAVEGIVGRSILLVDDDADVRMTLRHLLADEGFEVHTAHDGEHALHLLRKMEPPPTLIVLDYKMPVMDGKHFLAAMRHHARLEHIPVVLLSAWTRQWSGARIDVAAVLAKPVEPDVLVTTVHRLCGTAAEETKPDTPAER